MLRNRSKSLFLFSALVFIGHCRGQDSNLPAYNSDHQVSGEVRIWGSPQMGPLLELYERGFSARQPNVHFANDLRSTLTAVAGVYTERADVGLLGREIWPTEREAFAAAVGHDPTLVPIATGAFDVPKATLALGVFVPKANPLSALSILELERIFSNTTVQPARTWGDLGLKGSLAQHPIHLYGFAAQNDKALIFSDKVFHAGERWNCALHELSNDAGGGLDAGEKIARAVAADPDGIGMSNIHYANDGIKALSIALRVGEPAVPPSRATVASHSYPLFREVYAVLDRRNGQRLKPQVAEFLRFILSREGADAVQQEGNYLPLSRQAAHEALSDLFREP